jgi:hypothetical protein
MSYKPHRIRGLDYDLKKQVYTITEGNYTYEFDHNMMVALKQYGQAGNVESWYNDMSKADRKKVKRTEIQP